MILGENIGSVFNEGKEIQRVYSLGKLVWEKKNIAKYLSLSRQPEMEYPLLYEI